MRFNILLIILFLLTLGGVIIYNNYETSRPSLIEEPRVTPDKPSPATKNPLTPEDLPEIPVPTNTSVPGIIEDYVIVPQIPDEKGSLSLNEELSGKGFVSVINTTTDQIDTLEFFVSKGIISGDQELQGEAKVIKGENVICISAYAVVGVNYSRCFSKAETINNLISQYEDKVRDEEENAIVDNSVLADLQYQEMAKESAAQEDEDSFEAVSYNFEDTQ